MRMNNYRYICNGEGCSKECNRTTRHYTSNENFAKNKIRRKRKFVLKNGIMFELERLENG